MCGYEYLYADIVIVRLQCTERNGFLHIMIIIIGVCYQLSDIVLNDFTNVNSQQSEKFFVANYPDFVEEETESWGPKVNKCLNCLGSQA